MQVLLINPNYRDVYAYAGSRQLTPIFPPLGLAYIAAVLREHGINVDILDANALNLDLSEIEQFVNRHDIEYAGITATTNTIEEANKIAQLCPPSVTVVVGGYHASSLPRQTMEQFPAIDIVVKGEGEFVMLDLAQGKPLDSIPGIFWRGGGIVENDPRAPIHNIEALPFPARDLLPMEKYAAFGARRTPNDYILSSRGCPYSCIFCADHVVHGKKFRYRSPENVVEEIQHLVQERGVREIDFIDDNFTLLPQRVEEICDLMIQAGLNGELIWRCSNGVRIDRLSWLLLAKMKQAGCYMVALGIESGNSRILNNIKKGITLQQVEECVEWCREAGIETRGLFMLGNLGENEETMIETIEFAKKLPLDTANFHITVPFPMTEYWKIVQEEGVLLFSSWKDFTAYGQVTFSHGDLTPELLLRMQKLAYREFYARPVYILNQVRKIRSFHQGLKLLKAGIGILRGMA